MPGWRRSSSGGWRRPRRTSPELRDGAGVWRRHVAPSVTDLARVAAHYAIAGPSEGYGDPADVHAFRIERLEWARVAAGEASLAIGRVRVTAEPTTESEEADVAVLHAARRRDPLPRPDRVGPEAVAAARNALFREFPGRGRTAWRPTLERRFGGARTGPPTCSPTSAGGSWPGSPSVRWRPERTPDDGVEAGSGSLLGELRPAEGPFPPALASVARRSGVAKPPETLTGSRPGASVPGGRPDSRADAGARSRGIPSTSSRRRWPRRSSRRSAACSWPRRARRPRPSDDALASWPRDRAGDAAGSLGGPERCAASVARGIPSPIGRGSRPSWRPRIRAGHPRSRGPVGGGWDGRAPARRPADLRGQVCPGDRGGPRDRGLAPRWCSTAAG